VTTIDTPGEADFARMARAKVGSARVMFNWGHVEPSPGTYDWSETDRIVAYAALHRIPLLPFLYGTPDWARDCSGVPPRLCDRVSPLRSAQGRERWPLFVRALAERYSPGGTLWSATIVEQILGPLLGGGPPPNFPITRWQVWNEPNSGTFFQPSPTPAAYHALLASTAGAIRAVDPSANIVMAGLFGTPPRGQPLPRFLDRMYRIPGARNLFDAVAVHPYSATSAGIIAQLEAARGVMRKRGDKRGRLLLTELGWGSRKPPKKKRRTSLYKGPKGQSKMLRSSFKLLTAKRRKYRIDGLYWFSWRDAAAGGGGNCLLCESFGLLSAGSAAKPAFAAYRSFTGGAG
jgi:hypothetical protein